jgi:hypothetical protein
MLPYGYGTKSCQSCRDKDKARKKRKCDNENENNGESEASKRARVELENIDPSLESTCQIFRSAVLSLLTYF